MCRWRHVRRFACRLWRSELDAVHGLALMPCIPRPPSRYSRSVELRPWTGEMTKRSKSIGSIDREPFTMCDLPEKAARPPSAQTSRPRASQQPGPPEQPKHRSSVGRPKDPPPESESSASYTIATVLALDRDLDRDVGTGPGPKTHRSVDTPRLTRQNCGPCRLRVDPANPGPEGGGRPAPALPSGSRRCLCNAQSDQDRSLLDGDKALPLRHATPRRGSTPAKALDRPGVRHQA